MIATSIISGRSGLELEGLSCMESAQVVSRESLGLKTINSLSATMKIQATFMTGGRVKKGGLGSKMVI